MRLSELTDAPVAGGDPEIRHLTADSRAVEPGTLFAALPGTRLDGTTFVAEAAARGAVAVLAPAGYRLPAGLPPLALVTDPEPRRRLALLAARLYGPQPETVVAVTGTNGKTSVADFARQLWTGLGRRAASIGTLGLVAPGSDGGPSLTTPDPVRLHAMLAELAASGVAHVALEASSHGLAQQRLDGVRLAAAAFTNLTRDHLDYHGTEAAYLAAKRRLFDAVLRPDGTAVINGDSPHAAALAGVCAARGQRVWLYGRSPAADLRLVESRPLPAGQAVDLSLFGVPHAVTLPLIGHFQAENVLAALALVAAGGDRIDALVPLLPGLTGVRGRLELVGHHTNGAAVVVDYAHTPDALSTALEALAPHCRGRLHVVFGCGGDRDPGKRPQMAAAAAAGAARVIVTDDNPRSEDPAVIRRAALAGARDAIEIGDRAEAIAAGVAGLAPGDLLLIAGKGHEQGQVVGDWVRPFDDASVARGALAAIAPHRGAGPGPAAPTGGHMGAREKAA